MNLNRNNPRNFATETEWELLRPEIDALWSTRAKGSMEGVAGASLAYAYLVPEEARQAVVILPGRTEFIDKYAETAFDLFRQGFSVFLLDHRGQGSSDRLLSDSHKGHVESFDDYVEDLQQFLVQIVLPLTEKAPVLLGHSMGGAIAARHLQIYPKVVAAAVLCSPMLEINTGAPQSIVWPILARIDAMLAPLSSEPGYVPGGGEYKTITYAKEGKLNKLTSSERRLDYFNQQCLDNPSVQLGAPTRQWLLQAFHCMETVIRDADKVQVPVTLLISGGDRVVREGGQKMFVDALRANARAAADYIVIEDAEHELLVEADKYRLQALNHIVDFLDRLD